MKTCFKCNSTLPLSEFYKHPEMADGHLNKCKTCTKQDTAARHAVKSQDPQWVLLEAERQRLKQRRYRELGTAHVLTPAKKREVDRRWKRNNPIKHRAHNICQGLAKKPCEICGNPKADKHHEDYSKPLDVRWLCRKHHAARHVEMRQAQILSQPKPNHP